MSQGLKSSKSISRQPSKGAGVKKATAGKNLGSGTRGSRGSNGLRRTLKSR